MSEKTFDVLIIGAGPGGYVAAIRAGQLGLSTACIEEDKLGGVCLNIGCIPTKALLTSAALVNELKTAGSHGITFDEVNADLGPAQERSRAIAGQLSKGVAHLFKKYKVTHIEGRGRLLGGGKVEVEGGDGSKESYAASHIILATGSRPRDIPVVPIDEDRVWSSTGALFQTDAPESLAVVGAGAVGMEFADIFNAYGTRVTVIEALDRILPLEDKDSSATVQRSFKKRGVDFFTSALVQAAEIGEKSVLLTFKDKKGEEGDEIEAPATPQKERKRRPDNDEHKDLIRHTDSAVVPPGLSCSVTVSSLPSQLDRYFTGLTGLRASAARLSCGRVEVDRWMATGERAGGLGTRSWR